MFRKGKQLTATKEAPFAEDKLGYGTQIVRLADNIMKDTDTPLVMTLAAPWGSGKSSFIKMWKAYLESKGHTCILFDAWRNDFHKEPLLALVGEIGEKVAEICRPKSKKFEKIVGGIARPAAKILEVCAAAAPALALCGPTAAGGGVIAKGASGTVKVVKEYMQQGHGDLKKEIDAFRTSLSNLVLSDAVGDKHIYFFVDELDRCRPEYALSLLEIIKHMFDVEGIVFVLAIDRQQLISMASTRYGAAFDGDGYFKRFVDVEYVIAVPDYYDFLMMQILSNFEFDNRYSNEQYANFYCNIASEFARQLDLTPRAIEKALLRANVIRNVVYDFDSSKPVSVSVQSASGDRGRGESFLAGDAMVYCSDNLSLFILIVALCREFSYEQYKKIKNVFGGSYAGNEMSILERRIAQAGLGGLFSAMLSVDSKKISLQPGAEGVGTKFEVNILEYTVKWMNQNRTSRKSMFEEIVEYIELTREVLLPDE